MFNDKEKILVDISPTGIIIHKKDTGKFDKIPLETGIIKDYKADSLELAKVLKANLKASGVLLVLDIPNTMRLISYDVTEKDFSQIAKYHIQDHFPFPLDKYTVSYRRLDKSSTVLAAAAETEIIESYTKTFEKAKIKIKRLDIRQNFISQCISQVEKSDIILAMKQRENILIQFIDEGILKFLLEWDGMDINRAFAPYIYNKGKVAVKKVFLFSCIGISDELTRYFNQLGVDVIYIDEIYEKFDFFNTKPYNKSAIK